jgi:L-threonylcarbamoyladenylate synthase
MQADILQILEAADYSQDILRGVEALSAGKLLILPTETVYGVAGLLTHPDAREALHDLRQTMITHNFTVHVARPQDAMQYLGDVNDYGRRLMRKLWPGPVGLIYQVPANRRQEVVQKLVLTELDLYDGDAITLRCPDHRVFFDLVSQIDKPVALISPPGGPCRQADFPPEVLAQVEMVFDAGETPFSKPSTLLRVKEDSYEVVRAGVYDQRIIDRLLKTTVLFVCSGNTCRSSMAEALAKQYFASKLNVPSSDLERQGITIMSGGTQALHGVRAAAQAVEALSDMGIDLSEHRSRPVTVEMIHQADVVYAMSRNHARAVVSLVPSAADKTFPLDPENDIEDPIGGDISLYTQVAEQLKTLIERRMPEGIVT